MVLKQSHPIRIGSPRQEATRVLQETDPRVPATKAGQRALELAGKSLQYVDHFAAGAVPALGAGSLIAGGLYGEHQSNVGRWTAVAGALANAAGTVALVSNHPAVAAALLGTAGAASVCLKPDSFPTKIARGVLPTGYLRNCSEASHKPGYDAASISVVYNLAGGLLQAVGLVLACGANPNLGVTAGLLGLSGLVSGAAAHFDDQDLPVPLVY